MKLAGMIRDRGWGGNTSGLETMLIGDMRPKEHFEVGYQVCCPGVSVCKFGVVNEIDADNRLARVEWSSGKVGWWYLKDLVVLGYLASRRDAEVKKFGYVVYEGKTLFFYDAKVTNDCSV